MVLLHSCIELKRTHPHLSVSAIHIHHGLSEHADDWLAFCARYCEQNAISFYSRKVKVSQQRRESIEEQARLARYAAIDEIVLHEYTFSSSDNAKDADPIVLLGQHVDDQLETVFLQLKRGAGPKGLAGMAENFVSQAGITYQRPFLNQGIGKQDILSYAKYHELSWVEDDSNADSRFDRNFLRNEILPNLLQRWPQFATTVGRSAKHCAQQNQIVEELAVETLENMLTHKHGLPCKALLLLPNSLKNEVLRVWSGRFLPKNLSQKQCVEILKIATTNNDQKGTLFSHGFECRKFDGVLYWVTEANICESPAANNEFVASALSEEPMVVAGFHLSYKNNTLLAVSEGDSEIPEGLGERKIKKIALSDIDSSALVSISYGDLSRKLSLADNRPSKSLKAWLKEAKVPPWRRNAIPLLSVGEKSLLLLSHRDIF